MRDDMRYIRDNMVLKSELLPWKDDVQRQLGAQSKETEAVEERVNKRVDGVEKTLDENAKAMKAAGSAKINMWMAGGISVLVSVASFIAAWFIPKPPWP
jgi:hypothetical protein